MIRTRTRGWIGLGVLVLGLVMAPACTSAHAHEATNSEGTHINNPGFLVVAPDRGFWGNEETREVFEAFAQGRNAALAFVTDERTRGNLEIGIRKLAEAGARQAVVLPFFVSPSDPRFALAQALLAQPREGASNPEKPIQSPIPVSIGRTFGQSYLAVEALADRFRAIQNPAGRRVIVVGYGAKDVESRRQMEADWQNISDLAAEGFGFESVQALVWYDLSLPNRKELEPEVERALMQAVQGGERVVVVPFHLGKKLDGMMSFTVSLRQKLPAGVELIDGEVTPHPAVATWMAREANRHIPLHLEEVGVVFLAHGSDYHWNETMREAIRPLSTRYKVEFAFCMADPPLVERAVRRLERRGVRAVVVVRVFGLASNFREDVERMLGLDVGTERPASAHAGHSHGHDHGHGHAAGPPGPRIRSSALMATVGGLEDSPLFADALLDRARAISRDPGRETVILVAHGSGDDRRNEHWRRLLESMAERMRSNGGASFQAIRVATWREDWPDKRAPEVAAARRMVEEASRDGGRAIIIPARTTGQGQEREFLDGLRFELGSGFAPHPLFVRWFEEQIRAGLSALGGAETEAAR